MVWNCWRTGRLSPDMLHGFAELLGRERVEDIFFCKPGAAGLQDAVTDLVEVRGVVGVGVDYDLDSVLFRETKMAVAEIEAIGIGVQLHCDFSFGGGFQEASTSNW